MAITKKEQEKQDAAAKDLLMATKKENFTRLLKYRSTHLFKRIDSIKNLAGPSYEHEDWQIERFFEKVDKEVADMKAVFSADAPADELDLDTPPSDNGEAVEDAAE